MSASLEAIIAAYERTKNDERTRIPTLLMLAIENAKLVQQSASPFAERRVKPRYDAYHDLTTYGIPLKAGS